MDNGVENSIIGVKNNKTEVRNTDGGVENGGTELKTSKAVFLTSKPDKRVYHGKESRTEEILRNISLFWGGRF
jgi:hypothetical protein